MTAAEGALRDRIDAAGGSMSFEEFMRWALYDPAHGYYARRVRTVGAKGDFSTAATLGPALAASVAAWAAHHRPGGRWHLVELGPGSGELAAGVLRWLGWWARRGLRYHLVEVSEGLRETQKKRLGRWDGRVVWHGTLVEALGAAGGEALIFSNEFVDAFPCARWVLDAGGRWREGRVAWPDGAAWPADVLGEEVPEATRAVASVTAAHAAPWFAAGQAAEVFLSYREWQRTQLAGWRRGRMLTVDYGDKLPFLYDRRPRGTLRAYCRQLRFEGAEIYARVGQQDLTADVNFTDLQRWGNDLGLMTVFSGTQAGFLNHWLPAAARDEAGRDARLAAMFDPDGAGGAFRVLEQVRTDPAPSSQTDA